MFYVTSGGGYVNNGYSVALINVTSNAAIGQNYGKPLDNYGTIVSTDECIDYVTNRKTGTITEILILMKRLNISKKHSLRLAKIMLNF